MILGQHNKITVKIALFGIAVLLMGAMGISGGLPAIADAFPDASRTSTQMMVSLPSLLMIPCTLLIGRAQAVVSKKSLAVCGVLLYLIGGLAPVFVHELVWILVCRAFFGIGVGVLLPLLTVLVTEYFEEPERSKVMGQQVAAQMIGCAAMSLAGGYLADIGWNRTFLVYAVAAVSLVLALLFLPTGRPQKASGQPEKVTLNRSVVGWAIALFVFFIAGQVFATFMPFLINGYGFGAGAESGRAAMLFTVGGFLMGLFYGRISGALKGFALPLALAVIVLSFILIAASPSVLFVYAGSFAAGLTYAVVTPEIMIRAPKSVNAASAPMAISVVLCGQNVAQFFSPAIMSPAASAIDGDANRNAFLIGAAIFAAMTVFFLGKALRR